MTHSRSLAFLVLLFSAIPALAAHDAVVDATQVGAVGDGTTVNTEAIQKTIDSLSSGGGGILRFSKGRYLTGTLQLKSGVILRLEEEATLLGSTHAADYANVDPFVAGDGIPLGYALLVAKDVSNVGIEGTGTIDGQGRDLRANQNPYRVRPFLIRFIRCSNVTVSGVHLTNPGAWTLNFFQSSAGTIENVTIRTRATGLANNDGIDIDSSEHFRIKNCDVDSGDDALVIKSTSSGKPSHDITITDCKLATRTNAIKLGTESIGGFSDITVSHCQVSNTQMAGIALYSVDGGDLRNVSISDITMDHVSAAIAVRLGARLKSFRDGEKPNTAPGALRDVTIRNVDAKNIRSVGILLSGIPDHPIHDLAIENVFLDLPGGGTAANALAQPPEKESAYPEYSMFGTLPASAIYARHADGLTFKNIQMSLQKADARPPVIFNDVKNLTPMNFTPDTKQPVATQQQGPQDQK